MFKRIDHIEIISQNVEKSIEFYTDVLGFKIKERHNVEIGELQEVIYLKLADTVLEILRIKQPADLSNAQWQLGYRMMAIEVEDMDKAVAYLKNKGIDITWGPMNLGGSKRAEIKDPDGISIELRQW